MSRVSTLNIGIEGFTHVSLEQIESDFPQRFQLLPDGQAIATHLENLYELRPSEQYLMSLVKPKLSHSELLRPDKYRQQFDITQERLQELAQQSGNIVFKQALDTLQTTQLDQRYLITALNLLIQV